MDQSLGIRSPERARKRRRQDVDRQTKRRRAATEAEEEETPAGWGKGMIGSYVLKEFSESAIFLGKVVDYESGLYRVDYEDGDFEDLERSELGQVLIGEEYFDEVLMRRKRKLDDLVGREGERTWKLSVSSNKTAVSQVNDLVKGADDIVNEVPTRDENGIRDGVANGSEVDGNGDDDDDLSSDSDQFVNGGDGGLESESPVMLPPELPPSSGTLGVPEEHVPNLLSVYGFLRSFSASLFLSPFSLDDLVGCLHCAVRSNLLDAIHVALLKAIKRQLEAASSDGSQLASKCLMATDWALLDTLTWPVYLVHYLMVMGYLDGDEWKGFCIHVLEKDYCTLSAGIKLMVLQILCDDALDSEETRAEIDTRLETEVGIDAEGFETDLSESGPKRVHPRFSKTFAGRTSQSVDICPGSNGKTPSNSSSSGLKGSDLDRDISVYEDANSDDCRLCGMDGTLLCCDGCPSAYHSRCIGVSKMHIPEGPWFCPECSISKTEPTITVGTSLRGAELFGVDPFEQVFLGTCNHLLVLKGSSTTLPFIKYYSCNGIPKVLKVLHSSKNHSVLYSGICQAILKYWNMSQTPVPSETVEKGSDLRNADDEGVSTTICSQNAGEGTYVKAATEELGNSSECVVDNIGLPMTGKPGLSEIPLDECKQLDSLSVAGPGPNTNSKLSEQNAVGAVDYNFCDSCFYLGSSFKPHVYINHYLHGDFAASAAANLALLSSEEKQVSKAQASSNPKKYLSDCIAQQAKAFSLAATRFFWPNPDKKLIEVPRERCSWCLNCKASISSKKACLLNAAALNATRGAIKIISKLSLTKNVDSVLYGVAMYLLYMEEALHGLVVGPFMDASHRQQWRKQVGQITSFSEIKCPLLELEENVRAIAFSGEWIKQVDNLMSDSSATQSTCPTGSTQKRGPGRRRKHPLHEVTADDTEEKEFTWWRGGKLSKLMMQKGLLPRALMRKAARQGGLARVCGIYYAESSDVPKRSRQFIWRVAVELSKNISQLALQIRYLDHYIRWSDLAPPEQILDPKGPETEASAFRNARICDKKHVDNKLMYGVKFQHQRHLPSRLMKSIMEKEESQDGTEKYWFLEARVPLYLIREYEKTTLSSVSPPLKRAQGTLSKLQKRQLRASRKDLFLYLVRKRDNLVTCYCASCNRDVFLSNAVKCNSCEGYCHRECTTSSLIQTSEDVEFFITCKHCYQGIALPQNQSFSESPTSPLAMQRREYQQASTVSKSAVQKSCHKQPSSLGTQESSSEMKTKLKLKIPVPDTNQKVPAPSKSVTKKSKKRSTTWGLIWKKKNVDDTGTEFKRNHILWRADPNNVAIAPVCHLCHKPYNPHLMYIRCPACQDWFHADAVELDESKIVGLVGFKCCRCRRIKTPSCPYADPEQKKIEIKKLRIKLSDPGKVESPVSGAISERTQSSIPSIPSTPITPMEDDVLIQFDDPNVFPVSNAEPIAEQRTEVYFEWDTPSSIVPQKLPIRRSLKPEQDDVDFDDPAVFPVSIAEPIREQKTEVDLGWNTPSAIVPQKLPIRRSLKPEQDDGFSGISTSQVELFESNNYVSAADDVNSQHIKWDVPNGGLENGSAIDYGNFNFEDVDFEPQTYFSMGELLDPNDVAQQGVDELENAPSEWENWTYTDSHFVSEDQYDVETLDHGRVGMSDDYIEPLPSVLNVACGMCSQAAPAPDLCCQSCGLQIHSHCSPWEDLIQEESWKCGNCRAWK